MKKLTLAILIIFAFSSKAFALTSGSYFSVDGVFSYGLFHERYTSNYNPGGTSNDSPIFRGKDAGFGFSLKHAVNFGGPYIAPTIFYERLNNKVNGDLENNVVLELKNRFGGKVDLGYDLTDFFSVYALGGYAGVHYTATNYSYLGGSQIYNRRNTDIVESFFYGGGFNINVNRDFSVFAEYHNQQFDANFRIPNEYKKRTGTYNARVHVAKLGLAYHF